MMVKNHNYKLIQEINYEDGQYKYMFLGNYNKKKEAAPQPKKGFQESF